MSDMTIRVTTVEPLDDHSLRLTFNDGLVRDVDMPTVPVEKLKLVEKHS